MLGAVVAVGVPAGWWLNRPSPSAGSSVLANPAPTISPSTRPSVLPSTRPAVLPTPLPDLAPPLRLRIPGLDVDARVDAVGVRPDGAMEIPARSARVGWYRFGPAPGAPDGSAVIAGHVDTRAEGPGALFRLGDLEPGDRLSVERTDGVLVRYRVTGKDTIVKRRLPVERLFTRDGPPRLVLITCGGPFVPELSSYRDNLVVVAVPEG